MGTVNDGSFLRATEDTILFDGADVQREFLRFAMMGSPELGWRVKYVFREKAIKTPSGEIVGWNHAYRSTPVATPGWDRLLDADGNRLYRSTSFTQLFQFEAT